MNKKKATNMAAKSNNTNIVPFFARSAYESAILSTLLLQPTATVADLQGKAGNNPAEYVRRLRGRGLAISMQWCHGLNRYGRRIRYGVYRLASRDRDRVIAGLSYAPAQ